MLTRGKREPVDRGCWQNVCGHPSPGEVRIAAVSHQIYSISPVRFMRWTHPVGRFSIIPSSGVHREQATAAHFTVAFRSLNQSIYEAFLADLYDFCSGRGCAAT